MTTRRSTTQRLFAAAIVLLLSGCGSDGIGPETENPPADPELESISPATALVGGGPITLTATGSGFLPSSRVFFAGHELETTYVSSSTLSAMLTPELLQAAGTLHVYVHSEENGGTALLDFQVDNPVPTIGTLEPASLILGGGDSQLQVSGTGFTRTSVVLWNGLQLPTTFESNAGLTASVGSSLLNSIGQREIGVRNPVPGGGDSNVERISVALDPAITSFSSVALRADDIVFDPSRNLFYVSITGLDPTYPNTIAVLEPGSGEVVDAIPVGSEPGALAISDGAELLYVALDGAPVVRRIDLKSREVDLTLELGEDPFFGPYFTQDHTGSNRITRSGSAELIYGWSNEGTENGLREVLVTPTGLTEATVWNRPMGWDIEYDAGHIFSAQGTVVDALTGSILGSMSVPTSNAVAPDVLNDRAFFALQDLPPSGLWRLASYRVSTFAPVAEVAIPGTVVRRLIRWGDLGLAYVGEGAVAILTTSLVSQ
jgi:hypothetical protein